ncbi:YjcZ family sporulation protein [Evansella sp. AB-rgal1]
MSYYPGYESGCYPHGGYQTGFALVLVLFILLVIIGAVLVW